MTLTRLARPALSLSFTRAEVGAGHLWLQYSVDPVPEQVRAHGPVRDVACGVATDGAGVALLDCRASYRLALDSTHVVGVLAAGPLSPGVARLVLRFAPLVATPGLDHAECHVDVELTGDVVRRVSGCMR